MTLKKTSIEKEDKLMVLRMLRLEDAESVIVRCRRVGDQYNYNVTHTKHIDAEEVKRRGLTCSCGMCDGSDGFTLIQKYVGEFSYDEFLAKFN